MNSGKSSGAKTCARPVCHETLRIVEYVPPSALKTEMAKRVYAYFGVNLGGSKVPPSPAWVTLTRVTPACQRPKELAAGKFTFNISYSFTIQPSLLLALGRMRQGPRGRRWPGTAGHARLW